MRCFSLLSVLALSIPLCGGCSSDPANTTTSSSSGGGGGGAGGGGPMAICTMPHMTDPCEDQVVQQMNFKKDVAPGMITDMPDGNGFLSIIDATAGGFNYTDSYVYGRFTDKGLVKVDIGDEDSLTSMDWDIAFRRYVVRINSVNSGPSCVTATRLKDGAIYDDVMAAPTDLPFISDEYFSAACELIPDGSGLPGSPNTALHNFWTYKSCVQMTGNVFVLQKADGTKVKLTITDFYEPMFQDECNMTGSVPMGTPGATIRMRWALLP